MSLRFVPENIDHRHVLASLDLECVHDPFHKMVRGGIHLAYAYGGGVPITGSPGTLFLYVSYCYSKSSAYAVEILPDVRNQASVSKPLGLR